MNYQLSRRHDSSAKKVSEERFIQLGDALVNSTGTGTLGRVAQVREHPAEPTTVDSHVTIVRPRPEKFFPDFFGYMLVFIEDRIKEAGEGCGGQTELARAVLADQFSVAYPSSREEQQRIVGILDEAFAGIATAQANAQKNLHNARAIFASYLNNSEGPKVPLGDLVNITSGSLDSNEAVDGGKYPFFTCGRVPLAIDRYDFDCEAILLAGNNASADFNVKHHVGKFCARQRTYVITVRSEHALCRFLYFEILKGLTIFKQQAVGTGTKFIKLGMVKNLQVALPNLDRQRSMIRSLDRIKSETECLESLYQRKLAALEALKQSLLHQAFSGQL